VRYLTLSFDLSTKFKVIKIIDKAKRNIEKLGLLAKDLLNLPFANLLITSLRR